MQTMVLYIKAVGLPICKMDLAMNAGPMEPATVASTIWASSKVQDNSVGPTALSTMEISTIIILKDMEFIIGLMVDLMMENGLETKCTVREYLHGLMGENIVDSMWKTKSRDTALFIGLMVELLRENGKTVSNMASESTSHHLA